MEKSEAIEFCKVHYINYLGLAEGLLYTDYCAQVAVLLYSAFKANSKGSNTGRIFSACKKSACFQDMEISRFREVWSIVFPDTVPSLSTFKRSVETATMAFQAKGTSRDNDSLKEDRRKTIELCTAIKVACGREAQAATPVQNELQMNLK